MLYNITDTNKNILAIPSLFLEELSYYTIRFEYDNFLGASGNTEITIRTASRAGVSIKLM